VIVVIAVAYVGYKQYASFINSTKNTFLNLAKYLGLHGKSKYTYKTILELLLPYFDSFKCIPSGITHNAEYNVIKVV